MNRLTATNNILCSIALFALIGIIIVLSSVPPVSRDELTHHLAVPKLYIEHGGIYEIPNLKFSYYPMNVDLLYLIPLYFKNDIIPKYLHCLFALLTAGLIYCYLRKYASCNYGLVGMLFFLSTPVILKLSITAYVDLGLIFFSWLCVILFLKWYSSGYKIKYLVYAGIACGMALGTKYNGLVILFIMGGLTPLVYSRSLNEQKPAMIRIHSNRNPLQGLIYGVIFIMVALIVFSPWMIRNYLWTQNPIYPLYQTVFKSQSEDKNDYDIEKHPVKNYGCEEYETLNPFQIRRYVYHESLWESFFIPVRIFFQGQDNNPKYFDGRLNPFLFIFPFFAFWKSKTRNRELDIHKNILAIFTILFLLIALFTTDMRIRYISPIIPPLVVLSMLGLKTCIEAMSDSHWRSIFLKVSIFSLIVFAFFLNIKYIIQIFQTVDPISYILKQVDRDTYISRSVAEYPTVQYANKHLPKDARILCLLIGNRTYYLGRDFVLNENFFRKNSKGNYSEESLKARLAQSHATHIIFGLPTYQDWVESTLSKDAKNIFENFFNKYTKIIYEKNGYELRQVINR